MRRDAHRFDDLAGLQRQFERADDEILDRDRAHPRGCAASTSAPSADSADTQSAGGIGMAEAAADRAAIAHRAVGDVGATRRIAPRVTSGMRPSSISAWVTQAPSTSRRRRRSACFSSASPVMSTIRSGCDQAQIEHRPERLAARDDLDRRRRPRPSSASAPARSRGPLIAEAAPAFMRAAAFLHARWRQASPRRCAGA